MKFAAKTSTSVAKSKGEIEDLITRSGGTDFATVNRDGSAMVLFHFNQRNIMFELLLPRLEDFKTRKTPTGKVKDCSSSEQLKLFEQACRSAWRGLVMCVKAKFISIEMGVESFDEAFLPHIVVQGPNGRSQRFAAVALQAIAQSSGSGKPLQLLLGSGS
jgi:hypothetical protein